MNLGKCQVACGKHAMAHTYDFKLKQDDTMNKIRMGIEMLVSSESIFPLDLSDFNPINEQFYWMCHKCLDVFNTEQKYKKHVKNIAKHHKFLCPENGCKLAMLTPFDIENHLRNDHQKKEKDFCDICEVVLYPDVVHHERNHMHTCVWEGCNVATLSAHLLWRHMIRKHGHGTMLIAQ